MFADRSVHELNKVADAEREDERQAAEPDRQVERAGARRLRLQKTEIDAMLARLQALSDDHFNYNPDEITWDHVGTLGYYAAPRGIRVVGATVSSSGLPWLSGTSDGVEEREQFTHAGGERDFGGLTGLDQVLVEVADHWVAADGGDSRHIQDGAHVSAAPLYEALPTLGPAVAIHRCDADQRSDFASS